MKQFVELQEENECIYCIVDLHSITVPQDLKELRTHILDVAALYLSIGVDPKKSTVFVQSDVSGHSELAWILTCNSYTGELSRMTQFKDKSRGKESAPTGLFTYPILMAADILLYDTDIVPVGNDQKQHIEICRDIAIRVNHKYENTFVVPDGRFLKAGARIMALDDPSSKMSEKCGECTRAGYSLLDEDSKIKKSIMRATTDSDGEIRFDPENKPGVSNLLNIYSALSGRSLDDIVADFAGHGYGDLKKELVEITKEALQPIKQNFSESGKATSLKPSSATELKKPIP
ncbi:MAG: tryptophan--tRNA ligase [Anaerovoracaceae bacterium]